MTDIFEILSDVAESYSTALILGSSRTGKDLLADTIHRLSPRKKPFRKEVAMKRCGSLNLFFMILLSLSLVITLPLTAECASKEKPILVGAPISLSGPFVANAVSFKRAIEMAVYEQNAKGGINGRPLEIVYFDTVDLSPERVELGAKTLAAKKVAVAFGGWSGSGGDVKSYGKYKFPYFMNNTNASSKKVMMENPEFNNVFMTGSIEKVYAREYFMGMADLEKDFGYKYPNRDIALISADDEWSQGIQEGIVEIAKEKGWKVVMRETVPYGTTQWGPILAKLRALDPAPAWIQVEIISTQDIITLFNQFMNRPINTLINYGWSGNSPEFKEIMGKKADGIILATGEWLPLPPPTKAAQDWVDRFKKKFGAEPSAATPAVYYGVKAWMQAAEAVGDVTKFDEICEYVATHDIEAIPGIMSTFNTGFNRTIEYPYSNFPQAQFQNGEYATLYYKGKRYTDYKGISRKFVVPRWIKK
jgi:ABC-type branched-subunit amino acid transport system substrate-binding protein